MLFLWLFHYMMCWGFIATGFNEIAEKRQLPEDGWVLVVICKLRFLVVYNYKR